MIETIAACATAAGRAGIGVIRISGPAVKTIAEGITLKKLKPRQATYCKFYDAQQILIDIGLAVYFPAPHSYTGEDVLELQGHGNPAVLDQLLSATLDFGARLARPGEFTERAFLNNKLDLTQAEAVADLIDSTSRAAARSALESLQGKFSQQIKTVVDGLIQLRIRVEASIDFSEEAIDSLSQENIGKQLTQLQQQVQHIQDSAQQGCILRDGIKLVITGAPNVGKSTLLNALCQRDVAIVTDVPGTTRDVIRERIVLSDLPIQVVDTAGLRHSDDQVEQEGIRRAQREIEQADQILLVVDASDPASHEQQLQAVANQFSHAIPLTMIANKSDLIPLEEQIVGSHGVPMIYLSAKQSVGLDQLVQHLKTVAGCHDQQEQVFIARRRHLNALKSAATHLAAAKQHLAVDAECVAEESRLAQMALGEITGAFTPDDLLGEIFSSFCIGK